MDYSEMAMTKQRYEICTVAELPPGSRRIVEIGFRSIGVFNVDNRFYAVRNLCPHQAAPLCRGTLSGTMLPAEAGKYQYGLEGRILRCPWHSWEFDVTTGERVFIPGTMRVKTYEVALESSSVPESQSVEVYPVEIAGPMIVVYV